MEKKLKKVQRGAAVGFVVLKILRILLIICAVAMIAGLVFLAVANENDLPLNAVKDGKLVLDMHDLDLSQLNLDTMPDLGGLIQDGVLTLDLKDAKLVILMLMGVSLLILIASYVLLLIAGNLFKHMKKEETPFTTGNVRRLRLLGWLYIVFWICGIALSYFVASEFVRRLALPNERINVSLSLSSLLVALIFFFLARVFSFGKAQGDALQANLPAPKPAVEPVAEPVYQAPAVEPVPEPIPEPVVEAAPEPVTEPTPLPEEAPTTEPAESPAMPEE